MLWFSVAMKFAEMNGISVDKVLSPSWKGIEYGELNDLLNEYFNTSKLENSAGDLLDALKDGPVFGMLRAEDVDKNDIADDGHAVVITGYDPDSGEITYWDPETGKTVTGSIDDYLGGWDINGLI